MFRLLPRGAAALLLVGILAFGVACASSAAPAPKAPAWTQNPPAPDATYTYFVGYADAASGEDAAGTDAATASMVAEIMRYIGVVVTSESTAVAKATVSDFQADIVQTVKQSSSGRMAGFQVTEKYTAKRSGGITVYLLGRFETRALEAERRRIAAVFQEKIDAVARPEAEGKALLEAGDAIGAARKFIEAAVAASGSDIDNSAIKVERNLNAAKDAVSRLTLEKLNDNLTAAPGLPFAEPFRTASKANGRPASQVPFTVAYQAKLPNGRLTTKNVAAFSGADGVLSFAPPAPDFVGKATLTVRLDLSAATEPLYSAPDKFRSMVAGLEDEIASKRVSFSYSVVSAAKDVLTAVFIVDLEASGAPAASGNTTTALISTLASNGFSVSQAPLSADSVAGKDDGAVLAAAKAAVGTKAERLVYGTSRVVSSKDDRGQKIVTVSAEVKAVELSSGRILYSATKQASAVSSTEAQAAAAARRQLGQKLIGEDLAANLP